MTAPASPPELDAESLLAGLAHDDVDFVVIGGFAVIAHGVIRATKDVDVVVRPETPNYQRLYAALTSGALRGSKVLWESRWLDLDLADEFDLARGATYRIDTPFGWLDVLNQVGGAPPYDDLIRDSVAVSISGHTVNIASRRDLEAMKRVADRPRDRLDIGELKALDRLGGEGGARPGSSP